MNKKIKYAIPAFVAAFALMLVVATPYVMAESDTEKRSMKDITKYHKHPAIQVEGFVGTIPITKDTDKSSLKEQITVSLSDAAQGLDAKRASIGIVSNEDGDKFLAWTLMSMEKNSDAITITIHVVDAGDVENKAQITKEFDLSKIKDRMYANGKDKTDRV